MLLKTYFFLEESKKRRKKMQQFNRWRFITSLVVLIIYGSVFAILSSDIDNLFKKQFSEPMQLNFVAHRNWDKKITWNVIEKQKMLRVVKEMNKNDLEIYQRNPSNESTLQSIDSVAYRNDKSYENVTVLSVDRYSNNIFEAGCIRNISNGDIRIWKNGEKDEFDYLFDTASYLIFASVPGVKLLDLQQLKSNASLNLISRNDFGVIVSYLLENIDRKHLSLLHQTLPDSYHNRYVLKEWISKRGAVVINLSSMSSLAFNYKSGVYNVDDLGINRPSEQDRLMIFVGWGSEFVQGFGDTDYFLIYNDMWGIQWGEGCKMKIDERDVYIKNTTLGIPLKHLEFFVLS